MSELSELERAVVEAGIPYWHEFYDRPKRGHSGYFDSAESKMRIAIGKVIAARAAQSRTA